MTSPPRDSATRRLSDLDEEEILARILPLLRPLTGSATAVGAELVGPGDDAAVVTSDGPVVVTTDSMIRERDWRDDWSSPADVAAKLGAQNAADVAAMGAVATGAVLSLTADPQTPLEWVEAFAEALGAWCAQAGVTVVGGDLSSAPAGVLHVSMTMWGSLEGRAPVLRSGARVGDVVAVCGSLGWSGAGLASYLAGEPDPRPGRDSAAAERLTALWRWFHRSPVPPVSSGPLAAQAGATSMIDISDGLVRDARRVARASGVVLDLDRAALEEGFVSAFTEVLSVEDAWRHVLGGAEEHSLLATFPSSASVPDDPAAPWRVIGRVVAGEPAVTLDAQPVSVGGWDHFLVGGDGAAIATSTPPTSP